MMLPYKKINAVFLPLVCFSCLSCATTLFMRGQEQKIDGGYIGIVPGDSRALTADDMAVIDDLGIAWFRRTFRWSSIEAERGNFRFTRYDDHVTTGSGYNKKHEAILAYDVAWLPRSKRDHISREDLPLFLEYVSRTVEHYRGTVDVWEIWNEPNLPRFWKGNRADFFALVKESARVIRGTAPEATIVAGGFSRVPAGLIKQMFASGAFDDVDVISFHPYALNASGALRLYDRMEKLAREQGFHGAIWVTEMGYPTNGWYPNVVREEKAPAAIIKTLAGLAARGAGKIFWYELYDTFNAGAENSRGKLPRKLPRNAEDFFGLAHPDNSYKSGAFAFRLCARYLAGTTYLPNDTQKLPRGIVSMHYKKENGEQVLILWKEGFGSVSAQLSLPGSAQTRHVISAKESFPAPAQSRITINAEPLFFTWTADSAAAPPRITAVK
jgi:hypothetical protein